MTDLDAGAVAQAARAVTGVVELSTGPTDQFRSYLPGGDTVPGVRADDDTLRINVVAAWGTRLPALGDEVRAAVAPFAGSREVIVAVDDLVEPDTAGSADTTDSADRDVS